jgi:DNA-binding NtrC family response regulator
MTPHSHQTIVSTANGELTGMHRILIVDDEPAVLFAYRKLIEKEGMCVDISTTLNGAIKYISTCHYLAVVADVRLAGSCNEDGLELLRILRKEQPLTHLIVATGYGSSEIQKTARALGVSHYFEKPVQPSVLMLALKSFSYNA